MPCSGPYQVNFPSRSESRPEYVPTHSVPSRDATRLRTRVSAPVGSVTCSSLPPDSFARPSRVPTHNAPAPSRASASTCELGSPSLVV